MESRLNARTSRPRSRDRGYMMVILAISAMALCGTFLSTNNAGLFYETESVNRVLLNEQVRWLAEGILNHQIAVNCKLGPEANGLYSCNWTGTRDQGFAQVRPAVIGLTAGQLYERDQDGDNGFDPLFSITTAAGRESDGGGVRHMAQVRLVNGGNPTNYRPILERTVCRRAMFFQDGRFCGQTGSTGFFYSDL